MLGAGVDPEGLQFPLPEATSITVGNDGSLVALIRSTLEMAPILKYPAPVAVQGTGSGQVTRTVGFAVLSSTTFGLVVQAVDLGMPLQISMQLNSFSAPLVFTTQETSDAAGNFFSRQPLRTRPEKMLPSPLSAASTLENYFEQPVACSDVAIYKFFAAGVLEFITYLAGETSENAGFVRLSPGGSLVVAGTTDSADFPVTAAALQPLFPALRTTP
jgi:hypothetical protein